MKILFIVEGCRVGKAYEPILYTPNFTLAFNTFYNRPIGYKWRRRLRMEWTHKEQKHTTAFGLHTEEKVYSHTLLQAKVIK